jgi:hypothetical protein
MASRSWVRKLFARTPRTVWKAPARCRPRLEALEDRLAPAAPLVATGAAVLASSGTGATLHGTVNPEGSTASARFQYSTDPAFTPTLASTTGSGFNFPTGVAVDAAGDVFVADFGNDAVKEVRPDGTIRTLGSGFSGPTGVAVDAAGDVFVADFYNNAVKEVRPDGAMRTIGSGFIQPEGVAVDGAGDVFVADSGNNAVKEVLPDGTTRAVGSGFSGPFGVAVDGAGDVFVADEGNNAVKEVLPDGTIRTLDSGFNFPDGVAVDAAGDVFVADSGNNAVKEVLPDSTIRTLGSGFSGPTGVAVDGAGDVFVADSKNNRVVELSPPTVAATPSPLTGDLATAVSSALAGLTPNALYYYRAVASGPGDTVAAPARSFLAVPPPPAVATAAATSVATTGATLHGTVNPEGSTASARFQYSTDPAFIPTLASTIGSGFRLPEGVAVDAAGDVFVADFLNDAVKEVRPDGTIRTLGSGFNSPRGVAVDAAGDVFVADSGNNVVKEVLPGGTTLTLGSGFFHPVGVAVDGAGDVFVADFGNDAVKEVRPGGTTLTLGSGFFHPVGVAVDGAGDVFVADSDNNAVKEVWPDGTTLTLGSGFSFPTAVAVDGAGDVFVADSDNNAVKEVRPDGTILTLGSGFRLPFGVAVDGAGDVFVADSGNNRVVELSLPTVAATPSPLTGSRATAVSAALTGLAPGTTYYYRAVASGPGGTVPDSSAQSFTTPVATSFADLTGGSIPFGAGSVNLSGRLVTTPSTPFPAGSVLTVSINGVAETAALSQDGSFQLGYQFSAALHNFPLGVAHSPYAITYAYTDPSGRLPPASDSSQTLTVDRVTLTVTAADASRVYGVANPAFTAGYSGFVNGDTPGVVSGSPSLTTTATARSAPGTYPITVDVSALSAANYAFSPVSGALTVSPAPLPATAVNLSTPVGVPFSGVVATFRNADPFGNPISYSATIDWGDGSSSAGAISDSGGGTFAVSGSHTYTSPGRDPFSVRITHNQNFTLPAAPAGIATVSPDVVLGGTAGDDGLVLMRTAGGAPGDVTYVLNGAAPVALHGVTSFTFNGGGGDDTFTVDYRNGPPLLEGGIAFDGGVGVNHLVVDDSASSAATTLTVTGNQITTQDGTATVAVRYLATAGSFGSVQALTGAGNDTALIQSTLAGATTTVDTGAGNDSFYVSSAVGNSGNLGGLRGPLAIDAGAGSNFLTVSDASGTGPDTITLTDGSITDTALGLGIAYGGNFVGVNLATGPGAVRVNVRGTAAGASTAVLNRGGDDTIDVNANAGAGPGGRSGLAGPLSVTAEAGSDSVTLTTLAGAASALSLAPGQGTLTGPGYVVTLRGVASVSAFGGAADAAYFTASGGGNAFLATPAYAYLSGAGFTDIASGFGSYRAASPGGGDSAYLYDSVGNATFLGTPTYAYLAGAGFTDVAAGFARVVGNAGAAGDSADLYGSAAGGNTFVATPGYSYLSGSGYFDDAVGFQQVTATAGASSDLAYLYGSAGNVMVAAAAHASLSGAGYFNDAAGFGSVYGYSGGGGAASLLGTGTAADTFVNAGGYAYLYGDAFLELASGFASVSANPNARS